MPDSFDTCPEIVVRCDSALTSWQGNIDAHHKLGIGRPDLSRSETCSNRRRQVRDLEPDVVGLFRAVPAANRTAHVELIARAAEEFVVGGFDPSLAAMHTWGHRH